LVFRCSRLPATPPTNLFASDYANGKRVYLGNANAFLPRGRHVYTLTYTTNRQLGFFADHDELFWNVTGVGWNFPIDQASASVHVPSAIPFDQVTISGFTGPQGSHETSLTSSKGNGDYEFTATRPLGPREGLSVLLMWPKGHVAAPTFSQKLAYFFHDNLDVLLLAAGFLRVSPGRRTGLGGEILRHARCRGRCFGDLRRSLHTFVLFWLFVERF
jgi:hypothetical protein